MTATGPSFKLQIANNSVSFSDDQIYILGIGWNNAASTPPESYIQFDSSGNGTLVPVKACTLSSTYAIRLSSLSANNYTLTFPPVISARIYLSLGSPVVFSISAALTIVEPTSYDANDSNFYTIYDKIEFTFTGGVQSIAVDSGGSGYDQAPAISFSGGGGSGATATAVVSNGAVTTINVDGGGTNYMTAPTVIITPNGGGTGASATATLTFGLTINTTVVDFFGLPLEIAINGNSAGLAQTRSAVINECTTQLTGPWAPLILKAGRNNAVLRVSAPNDAVAATSGDGLPSFDQTYFDDYIAAVWTYYESNQLSVDCTGTIIGTPAPPHPPTPPTFTGSVSNGAFNFNNSTGQDAVVVNRPTSNDVFLCSGAFGGTNGTPQAVIGMNLAAAMNIGLLPIRNPPSTPVLGQAYFRSQAANFYKPFPPASNSPSYNLYSAAIHSFGDLIYAFPYDDAVAESSTLTGASGDTCVVTLHSLDGNPLPDISDSTTYSVTFLLGSGASGTIDINGTQTNLTDGPFSLTSPFQIQYNLANGCGAQPYTINLHPRFAQPQIGINVTISGTNATVALPGAPI